MIIKFEGTVTYDDGTTASVSIAGTPAVEAVAAGAVDFSTISTQSPAEVSASESPVVEPTV